MSTSLSPARGLGARFGAQGLQGARSPLSLCHGGERCRLGRGRPAQPLAQQPIFPLAARRTGAEYVLARGAGQHLVCISASCGAAPHTTQWILSRMHGELRDPLRAVNTDTELTLKCWFSVSICNSKPGPVHRAAVLLSPPIAVRHRLQNRLLFGSVHIRPQMCPKCVL